MLNNRSQYCGKYSLVGQMINKDTGQMVYKYSRLDCKTYGCGYCGDRKVKRLRRAITKQAINLKLQRLLTLTLNPQNCSAKESIRYVRYCWSKLRTYLKRLNGKGIVFIAVLELQKSGYAHLHVLVDRYIPQGWISEAWNNLGGGKIIDIRYVDIHRVAGYLTKYLTKEMLLGLPRGQKRYTTSRNIKMFEKLKKDAEQKWEFMRLSIFVLYELAGLESYNSENDDGGYLKSFMMDFPISMLN